MRVEARAQDHVVKKGAFRLKQGGSSGWLVEAVEVTEVANRVPHVEVIHVDAVDPSVAAIMVAAAMEDPVQTFHIWNYVNLGHICFCGVKSRRNWEKVLMLGEIL